MRALLWLFSVLMVVAPMRSWAVNLPPVVDGLSFSTSPVGAHSAVTITCRASDDSSVATMRVSVTGGTLPGGGSSANVPLTPSLTVVGSVVWNTPAAGLYTVTCDVADDGVGSSFGPKLGRASVPVTVVVPAGSPPVIDALIATPTQVKVGGTVQLTAVARDVDGDALTWSWSSDVGVLSASGGTGTWTAPAQAGNATITLVVSDSTGRSASATVAIAVRLELYAGGMPARLIAPRRIAAAPGGDFYVTDGAQPHLAVLTARGEIKALFTLPESASAVTRCWGELLVATQSGRVLALDDRGQTTRELALTPRRAAWPTGLACDDVAGVLFIAEHDAGSVRAVDQRGATRFSLGTAGGEPLGVPADVAVDPVGQRLLVLVENNRAGAQQQLRSYALNGAYLSSAVGYGTGRGTVTRGAGVAVGPQGRIYVADGFQSVVQVFDAAFTPIGEFGGFGGNAGDLQQPAGMLVNGTGDLLVASTGAGRLEVYGQPLGSCPNDLDCDGLPDAWEQANGFNPRDPRDGLADPDGDGLSNARELALGTNPRAADTDGDGYSDGDEVLAGLDPNFAGDHPPLLVTREVVSAPGLVRLSAELRGRGSCRVLWSQLAGPPVTLSDDSTPTPAFVGRAAGTYAFEGRASCNGVLGAPQAATAVVRQVAPRVDPGRVAVVKTGEAFLLDSSFSWDPNGEALTAGWDQVLGPPRLGTTAVAKVWARAQFPGLYGFEATVGDAAGQAGSAAVPVLVVDARRQAPTAMVVTPVTGKVGKQVSLDASSSVGPPGVALQFTWRQVSGPTATLHQPLSSRPLFMPAEPGHYRFEVSAREGSQSSPWEAVDVYVANRSGALPVAATAATRQGVVGEPMTLSGVRSRANGRGALAYRWRQVSGAAAGLTNETSVSATVVPFAPGLAVFELVVSEDGVESVPALVKVSSEAVGQARPVAVASGPPVATAQTEVWLDGSASTGTGTTLQHRWTQVAGPWVALDDARGELAAFRPLVPGLYVFELEVDDGVTRSAPAPVGVLVFPAAGARP